MANWDGQERRRESADVSLQLQKLNQSIEDKITPLLEKHDKCLYGEKGDNGMVKAVSTIKSGIGIVKVVGIVIFSLGIFVIALIDMLKEVGG